MITESNRKRELIINLYSLLANIGISIWFYCLFDESASMILPIVFISTPWLFKDILLTEDSQPFSNRKFLRGFIYWLIYNFLNLLILIIYYSAEHGRVALYYVVWDEVICLSSAFSLLQLLSILIVSGFQSKKLRIGVNILSMVIDILLLALIQLVVFYYSINIGILYFVFLGVLIVVYGTAGALNIRKEKCNK